MYKTIENIFYVEKVDQYKRLYYLNLIDSQINTQRIYLRIMYKNKGIDKHKFKVAMENKTYKHGNYKIFYIKEPKLRKIKRSRYIDRIVHRWYVDNFLKEYLEKQFISTSFACIKNRGTHKACLAVQKGMQHCKKIWNEYYILKMDVAQYFQNIDKEILMKILKRKIKDKDLLWLTQEIVYSSERKK